MIRQADDIPLVGVDGPMDRPVNQAMRARLQSLEFYWRLVRQGRVTAQREPEETMGPLTSVTIHG